MRIIPAIDIIDGGCVRLEPSKAKMSLKIERSEKNTQEAAPCLMAKYQIMHNYLFLMVR